MEGKKTETTKPLRGPEDLNTDHYEFDEKAEKSDDGTKATLALKTTLPESVKDSFSYTKMFEITFELAWDTRPFILTKQGEKPMTPRDILKKGDRLSNFYLTGKITNLDFMENPQTPLEHFARFNERLMEKAYPVVASNWTILKKVCTKKDAVPKKPTAEDIKNYKVISGAGKLRDGGESEDSQDYYTVRFAIPYVWNKEESRYIQSKFGLSHFVDDFQKSSSGKPRNILKCANIDEGPKYLTECI